MGFNIKTIFDLVSEEEIDKSYDDRKQRKDKLIELVTTKIDKLTDEQLNKLIEFFTDLR